MVVRGVLVLLVAGVLAAPAGATSDPRVAGLQRQVTALQRVVRAQTAVIEAQTQAITTLRTDLERNINFDLCSNAVYWDTFHSMFKVEALLSGLSAPVFTPVDDQGNCAKLGVARTPQSADWLSAMNRGVWVFNAYARWVAAR